MNQTASGLQLRDYQAECIRTIENLPPGRYLAKLATGLGKTVIFTSLPRRGRVLLLSHREELVTQPLKYYTCPTGMEMGKHCSGPLDEVVSSTVQTMVHRYDLFDPHDFDTIICDEAHHAAARTYREIFDYFKPRLLLGFTATPNRSDKARLDDLFQDIIFDRDLQWGIRNGYLSDIKCLRANIGYDLSAVHTRNGDYAPGELEQAMDGTADAIAEAYQKLAKGATLIFAVSVHQCEEIARRIPGAVVVTGKTPNRADIIRRFTDGEIPCIVNCMVFTEGTDIPRVETVIIARPTQSDSLYTQMVGRGLRLYPGKQYLTLIDCVGVSSSANLCTAPTLLGIDLAAVPPAKRDELDGMLFDLPEKVTLASDAPESWIRNVELVDLWAKGQKYETHGVNWFKMPNGAMVVSLPERKYLLMTPPDELGRARLLDHRRRPTIIGADQYPVQKCLDAAYRYLLENCADSAFIWNLERTKSWGRQPASEAQMNSIRKRYKAEDIPQGLTKLQASQILNRAFLGKAAMRV